MKSNNLNIQKNKGINTGSIKYNQLKINKIKLKPYNLIIKKSFKIESGKTMILAVYDFKNGKLIIYQNPAKNNLNFSLPNAEKIAKNFYYQHCRTNHFEQRNFLNLENLKLGVYLVTITKTKGISYPSK